MIVLRCVIISALALSGTCYQASDLIRPLPKFDEHVDLTGHNAHRTGLGTIDCLEILDSAAQFGSKGIQQVDGAQIKDMRLQNLNTGDFMARLTRKRRNSACAESGGNGKISLNTDLGFSADLGGTFDLKEVLGIASTEASTTRRTTTRSTKRMTTRTSKNATKGFAKPNSADRTTKNMNHETTGLSSRTSRLETTVTAEDPCVSAPELPYMTERVVGYKIPDGGQAICDYYLNDGWYYMENYVLADSAKECGTDYNWYMTGKLPTTGQSQIQMCKNSPNDNCSQRRTVTAMFCGKDKYAFNLSPLDSCNEAYCIKRITGVTGAIPVLSSVAKPTIETEVIKINGKNELTFYCAFTPPPNTNYLYDVLWSLSTGHSLTKLLHSTKSVRFQGSAHFKSRTQLTERHLKSKGIFKLGFSIACSIKAKQGAAGTYSRPIVSNTKFCGVEVRPQGRIILSNTNTAIVKLRRTVPFGCVKSGCQVNFMMYIPKPESRANCQISQATLKSASRKTCVASFKDNGPEEIDFTIEAVVGQNLNPFSRLYAVQLVSQIFSDHPIFGNYTLDPIRVQLTTTGTALNGRKCYAHSDPHMMSFDGQSFENQNSGVFILYRNIKYNVEVQMQTAKCSNWRTGGPWCVCGVAIRAGRDVYRIYKCNTGGKLRATFERCDDRILHRRVKRGTGGRDFRVYLPTGTDVVLRMGSFIEVDILPSIVDEFSSDGLCGRFDNKRNDPGKGPNTKYTDNVLSWRVLENENLFNLKEHKTMKNWKQDRYFCTCNNDKSAGIGGLFSDVATCDTAKGIKCLDNKQKDADNSLCEEIRNRRKRSTEYLTHYSVDSHMTLDTDMYDPNSRLKRSKQTKRISKRNVYTEETARHDCIQTMNTTAFQMCSRIPSIDINSYVENCVSDAMVTHSMEWTSIHLEGLKRQCVHNVEVNQPLPEELVEELNAITEDPASFQEDVNGTSSQKNKTLDTATIVPDSTSASTASNSFEFTPELLEEIQSVACPNDCSGHGVCKKGYCTCNPGFIDTDCSVDENEAPEIYGIPDRGICDLRQRLCEKTSVLGKLFVETPKLSCKLQPFEVDKDGQINFKPTLQNNASLETFAEVRCGLPSIRKRRSADYQLNEDFIARGFGVSISNNGEDYSAEDIIVIFDSECVNCSKENGKVICKTKDGYCMNNGHCYRPGEQYGCYSCLEHQPGKLAWTAGPDCPVPASPPAENKKLWIIGATLGPAAAVVIAITAFICYQTKKNQRGRKMGSVSPIYGEQKT